MMKSIVLSVPTYSILSHLTHKVNSLFVKKAASFEAANQISLLHYYFIVTYLAANVHTFVEKKTAQFRAVDLMNKWTSLNYHNRVTK